MGNRVKGKPKKKSIKAASHSGMGSKRKLSRMGKKRKKDHAGLDATFIGRAACLRRLQISLKDFRRLCILKGVYPREPRGRAPGNKKGQTYYHVKDVRAIAHEPVLEKFREFRAFMKKVRKAAGRNEKDEAARQHSMAPVYTLHHLVRERYPRFGDALNDLDDALTLCYLFAALPSEKDIPAKVTNKAKALAGSWAAYCATTSSVTKTFISVKGVYMEAIVHGSTVRWVVPHSFTQNMPNEIDYKVMLTFFEFYQTLLSFVLFKLYNELGLRFPLPAQNLGGEGTGNTSAVVAANLKAITTALTANVGGVSDIVTESIEVPKENKVSTKTSKKSRELMESVGAALTHLSDEEDEEDEEDEDVDVAGPLRAALDTMAENEHRTAVPGGTSAIAALDSDATKRRHLFAGLVFFLSREVPRGYLELVCLAFGGRVGWDGPNSPITVSDPSITHQLVDRPKLPASYDAYKSREFVQPQWVLDCANFMFVLPIRKYAVGASLPPHLSPWVDDEEEGYKPAYAEEIERLKNGEPLLEVDEDDGRVVAMDEEEEEDAGNEPQTKKSKVSQGDNEEEEDDDDDGEEEEESVKAAKAAKAQAKADKEAHDLAKVMMSKKASRLYGRMQRGISAKQAKVDEMARRRKELEDLQKPRIAGKIIGKETNDGQTPLKQKVIRLKNERRKTEKEYSETGGSMKKSKKRRTE
jgi:pescadillo protein